MGFAVGFELFGIGGRWGEVGIGRFSATTGLRRGVDRGIGGLGCVHGAIAFRMRRGGVGVNYGCWVGWSTLGVSWRLGVWDIRPCGVHAISILMKHYFDRSYEYS